MAVIRKVISILRLWGCGEVRHDGRAKGYRQVPEEASHAVVQSHSCLHFLFLLLSLFWPCGSRSRLQIPDPTFNIPNFPVPRSQIPRSPILNSIQFNSKFIIHNS